MPDGWEKESGIENVGFASHKKTDTPMGRLFADFETGMNIEKPVVGYLYHCRGYLNDISAERSARQLLSMMLRMSEDSHHSHPLTFQIPALHIRNWIPVSNSEKIQ